MRRLILALCLLLILALFSPSPVSATTQELVVVDQWDFSNAQAELGASGRLLSDNHPSDSGSTSSLGQTFRPLQNFASVVKATFSMSRGGAGSSPTATLIAIISSSDGQLPTTELYRSTALVDSSIIPTNTFAINKVSFSFNTGQLSANTWYSLEVQTSATGIIDLGNSVSIHIAAAGLRNHQGQNFYYSSAGYQVITGGTEDFVFEILGETGGGTAGGTTGTDSSMDQLPVLPVVGGSTLLIFGVGLGAYLLVRGRKRGVSF